MIVPEGPRANIEIKARLPDLEAAVETARSLGANDTGSERQTDVYFPVPRGRLKLRSSSRTGDQLVAYIRPDEPGPTRADYEVIAVRPDGRTRELIERMFGVDVVVEKTRRVFLLENTRIHLDEVERLGTFLELEAVYEYGNADAEERSRAHVEQLVKAFKIGTEDLLPASYRELVQAAAR